MRSVLSAVMPEWTPPSEFDGHRLLRPPGRGGMGQVFLGLDLPFERWLATGMSPGLLLDPAPIPLLYSQESGDSMAASSSQAAQHSHFAERPLEFSEYLDWA